MAESAEFWRALRVAGFLGEVRAGVAQGHEIDWKEKHVSLASKKSGQFEDGTESGPLIAFVFPEKKALPIATLMAITPEIVKAIDKDLPPSAYMSLRTANLLN